MVIVKNRREVREDPSTTKKSNVAINNADN